MNNLTKEELLKTIEELTRKNEELQKNYENLEAAHYYLMKRYCTKFEKNCLFK